MSYQTFDTTSVSYTSQYREVSNMVGRLSNDDSIRSTALHTCAFLKYYPAYTTEAERNTVEAILGEETSRAVDKYFQENKHSAFQMEPFDAASVDTIRQFYKIVRSYELSKERCQLLERLILDHPFIAIVDNQSCRASNGAIFDCLRVKLETRENRIGILAGQKIGLIQTRTQDRQLMLTLISQAGWARLQNKIAAYDSACCTIL